MIRGAFTFYLPGGPLVVPNTFLNEGEDTLLKMALRGDNSIVAGGGNFYIGLCGAAFAETTTLTTLAGEPSATNGYARQAITRDATGWPTIDSINGAGHARSAVVNFTASGGDFSASIERVFLCTVGSGTSGKLLSVSAALPAPLLITNGYSLPVQYDIYMN